MFWRSVFDFFGFSSSASSASSATDMSVVNPATGLPMMDNSLGGVDVGGSPYGTDIHHSNTDSFSSGLGSNPWD